ncbi:MAG TPA: hypothetical protein VF006_29415 [Longimicrobium sp.]
MRRFFSILAALALSTGAVQPAAAAPATADDDALTAADAASGVLQQGKGQGGGQGGGAQEARGGRGQGGGGQEARESRGRSGGGSDARPARQGGEGRGQGQSARGTSGERSSGSGSGASARSGERGKSSDDARGSSGNAGGSSARRDDRASGNSANAGGRGNSGASADRSSGASGRGRGRMSGNDLQSRIAALPEAQRRLANSARVSERMAVGAIARGHARGLPANAFDVRSDNDRVRILNRRGDVLFDMDDRRAGELGGWQMRRLGDQAPRANAPAFCRSGQGHPVQGREWCIEKGFGLGSRSGTVWSRGGIGDVVFRSPDYRTRLDRGGLLGVLGDVVLGRLGLQSVALGYDQPLTGYWVAEPEGPRILRVRSGDNDVAEFYDRDRNDRVEVLYVVQPVW